MEFEDLFNGASYAHTGASGMLREQRLVQSLTQKAVAKRAKIPFQSYQKFESGERDLYTASFTIACRVLEALNMDISKFYHGGYAIGEELYSSPEGLRYKKTGRLTTEDIEKMTNCDYAVEACEQILAVLNAHPELKISDKGMDEVPAMTYAVADLMAFVRHCDKELLAERYWDWLMYDFKPQCAYASTDTLSDYMYNRYAFYAMIPKSDVVCIWVQDKTSVLDAIEKNFVHKILVAFTDCLLDNGLIENYDSSVQQMERDTDRDWAVANLVTGEIADTLFQLVSAINIENDEDEEEEN